MKTQKSKKTKYIYKLYKNNEYIEAITINENLNCRELEELKELIAEQYKLKINSVKIEKIEEL